jgi:F-type H+-transporting ATPase subunit b
MFLIPHLGTIIWTTLIFLGLLFILTKFAWKPLLKAIEDREHNIATALKNASIAEEKVKNLQSEQDAIVLDARLEKDRIVKEGIEQRDKIVASAREKAQLEADKIIEEARKQLIRERDAVLSEMKNQIATLSVEIATKVVKADMEDPGKHEKLVRELIRDVELN